MSTTMSTTVPFLFRGGRGRGRGGSGSGGQKRKRHNNYQKAAREDDSMLLAESYVLNELQVRRNIPWADSGRWLFRPRNARRTWHKMKSFGGKRLLADGEEAEAAAEDDVVEWVPTWSTLCKILKDAQLARLTISYLYSLEDCELPPTEDECWQGIREWQNLAYNARNDHLKRPDAFATPESPFFVARNTLDEFRIQYNPDDCQTIQTTRHSYSANTTIALTHAKQSGQVVHISQLPSTSENVRLWSQDPAQRFKWLMMARNCDSEPVRFHRFLRRYQSWSKLHNLHHRQLPLLIFNQQTSIVQEYDLAMANHLQIQAISGTDAAVCAVLRALGWWCLSKSYAPNIVEIPPQQLNEWRADPWKCIVAELTAAQMAAVMGIPYKHPPAVDITQVWIDKVLLLRSNRQKQKSCWFNYTYLSALERADCYAKRLLYPESWK